MVSTENNLFFPIFVSYISASFLFLFHCTVFASIEMFLLKLDEIKPPFFLDFFIFVS